MRPMYLDYNASTPIDPAVAAAMRPFLEGNFGNPSSGHWAAAGAKAALDEARSKVARLLGAGIDEIVFTSGGSESNNLALKGVAWTSKGARGQIITSAVEHPSVVNPCRFLSRHGFEFTQVAVDGAGRIDPDDVRRAITPRTILVSIMHANNEVGTIQPIAEVSRITRAHGILLHTDAAQSIGKIATDVGTLGVDLLTLAGHKFYAPKGIGALYVRRGTPLEPLIHGAGHEGGRRAGTESALLAAGLGTACDLARELQPRERVRTLRDRLWQILQTKLGHGVVLNGHPEHRLPNTLNVSFAGCTGAEILAQLDGVAASTGSACHAGRMELSPVLKAMGIPPEIGMGAIRFSLGCDTTQEEIDAVADRLAKVAMVGR
jgi:cysteine desulfurase